MGHVSGFAGLVGAALAGSTLVVCALGCGDEQAATTATSATSGTAAGGGGSGGETSSGGAGTGGDGAGGSASGGSSSGGGAPSGESLVVGVGNWGLRVRTSDGSDWAICQNPSTGNDHSPDLLRNVAYGDGVFVAVGGDANSMVMRSLDGVHWEEDLHPTDNCAGEPYPASCSNWMGGVAYGGGVWLAGGGNGALMRSLDDGQSWTGLHPDPKPNAIRDVAFGAGRFIAGTDGGVVIVSADAGDSWTDHALWDNAMSITFGGGVFIAKGRNWNGSGFDHGCSISLDLGDSWGDCASEILTAGAVVWDGARWVAGSDGGYLTSADGVSWTPHTSADFPGEYLFDGSQWIGLSGGNASTSSDLDSWTPTATGLPGFRAWVAGTVLDENLPVRGVPACEDNG